MVAGWASVESAAVVSPSSAEGAAGYVSGETGDAAGGDSRAVGRRSGLVGT